MIRKLLTILTLVCAPACTQQTPATTAPTAPTAPAPVQHAVPAAAQPVVAADLIEVHATPANRFISAAEPDTALVRVAVKARALEGQPRPRANVALLVDTSASMKGEGIEHAREAAISMLEALETGDRLSLVAFHSRADVLVRSTVIDEDSIQGIRAAMESMEATGTTAMTEGLQLAAKEVKRHAAKDNVSRVVLLSDGIPNSEAGLAGIPQQLGSKGIGITALGLGIEYHESLLARLAQQSGGRFHHVEEPHEVAAMFQDEVLHLARLVATHATVSLTCGPGVTIDEVVGWPQIAAGSPGASVTVGDLAENEIKNVIVRLSVSGRVSGATVELMDVNVQYGDPVTNVGILRRDSFLAVEATDDAEVEKSGADVATELVVARAVAAAALLAAVAEARSGRLDAARARLRAAEKVARRLANRTEDAELSTLAAEMISLTKALPSLVPPVAKVGTRRKKDHKRKKHNGHASEPLPAPNGQLGRPSTATALKASHSRAFNALH